MSEKQEALDPETERAVLEIWKALTKRKANRPAHALPVQIYPDPQKGVAGALRPILRRLIEAERERCAKVAERTHDEQDSSMDACLGHVCAAAIRWPPRSTGESA